MAELTLRELRKKLATVKLEIRTLNAQLGQRTLEHFQEHGRYDWDILKPVVIEHRDGEAKKEIDACVTEALVLRRSPTSLSGEKLQLLSQSLVDGFKSTGTIDSTHDVDGSDLSLAFLAGVAWARSAKAAHHLSLDERE